MLNTILAIAGKPGLYKLVSQAKNMLIVETVSADKKRIPVYASDKVISLGDIAMYTDAEEIALGTVLESVKTKEGGKESSFNYKKASTEELHQYMAEVLPTYDRDRVHTSDIKKLIQWYNLLISNGITEFAEQPEEEAAAEEVAPVEEVKPAKEAKAAKETAAPKKAKAAKAEKTVKAEKAEKAEKAPKAKAPKKAKAEDSKK